MTPTKKKQLENRLKEIKRKKIQAMTQLRDYKSKNLIEFFNIPKEEGGMPANPLQLELLEAWDNPLYRVFTYTGANRIGKCATALTPIDTPSGKVLLGDLYKTGRSFDVFSWDGNKKIVARAMPPFKKKNLHKCYRIEMRDKTILELADHHRVLTSNGWFSVEQLQEFFPTLQGTSLEPCQLTHVSDDHRCSKTASSYLDRYLWDYGQYDERPLFCQDIDQSFFPLLTDAQQRGVVSCNLDDQVHRSSNTPLSEFAHPSILDGPLQSVVRSAEFLCHFFCKFLIRVERYIRFVLQPIGGYDLQLQSSSGFYQSAKFYGDHQPEALFRSPCKTTEGLIRNSQVFSKQTVMSQNRFQSNSGSLQSENPSSFSSCHSPFNVIGDNDIINITPIDTCQEVYDFHVPKYKNYFAGGIVHHNTTIGAIIAVSLTIGHWPWNNKKIYFPHSKPRKIRYVGQDWDAHVRAVVVPALKKWWPDKRKVDKKKNNQGVEANWTDIKTGSTIQIMSNKQDSEVFEGEDLDAAIFDEPPKRDIRVACARGLIDRSGRELFCMTLLKEAWVDREVIKALDDDGKPDRTVFSVNGDIQVNVGFGVAQVDVDQFAKTLTEEEKQARLHGKPSYLSGLVYPQFSRAYKPKGHLVERFDIPSHWIVDIALDIHPRERQAVLFVATSPKNERWGCEEIWEHGDGDAIADEILRRINRNNYRVGTVIIDPLSKGDDQNDEDTTFKKVQRKLWRAGIPLRVASKDKTSGILQVRTHLMGPNKEPSIWFFNDLVRTIFEFEGYMYKEGKPVDADDHMMENLYRLLLLDTKYVEPEDEDDEDEYDDTHNDVNAMTGY